MANVGKRGFSKTGTSTYTRDSLEGLDESGYFVTVEKESAGRWIVYAEDHEPTDIQTHLGHDEAFYPTLSAALDAAIEFSNDFCELWEENNVGGESDTVEQAGEQATEEPLYLRLTTLISDLDLDKFGTSEELFTDSDGWRFEALAIRSGKLAGRYVIGCYAPEFVKTYYQPYTVSLEALKAISDKADLSKIYYTAPPF